MAITSEIIGKLGGGGGEAVPVSGTASGDKYTSVILHTFHIPAGETWLVALHGDLESAYTGNSSAQLAIGDTTLPDRAPNGTASLTHIGTGVIDVRLIRNSNVRSDSFTGHVSAAKL